MLLLLYMSSTHHTHLAGESVQSARAALSSIKPSPDTTAFEAGKEVMEKLRSLHMVLGSTMESMLQVWRAEVEGGWRGRDCE